MKIARVLLSGVVFIILILSGGAGCGKGEEQQRAEKFSDIRAQEEAIRNNPNMPPQAKDIAIRQLHEQSKRGQQSAPPAGR